ncbi:hypothetical protein OLX02_06255 [Novosphingobium sp. KCTC 2891]|uniref:hypothetical protein n=1 Tax=Novosphingobium sp. KCTC 2891 TaxID=2989730 RepID=UPI0022233B42|nr:hypothetical protein [Novosphingobium sp. KCTC 2891]MCW1382419.1 hypothetical protein [Novosphingobium sp. KCTC 2891]
MSDSTNSRAFSRRCSAAACATEAENAAVPTTVDAASRKAHALAPVLFLINAPPLRFILPLPDNDYTDDSDVIFVNGNRASAAPKVAGKRGWLEMGLEALPARVVREGKRQPWIDTW